MAGLALRLALGFVVSGLAALPVQAADTAAGVWAQVDDKSGRVRSHVRIAEQGGRYHGTILRFFPGAGEPAAPVCDQCPGRLKNHPIVGLRFLIGLVRKGSDYTGGQLIDPETGQTYQGQVTLGPDGRSLTLRGYVGSPIFGRSQTWRRGE